jgi:plastocyanin
MKRCTLVIVVLGLIAVLLSACSSGSDNVVTVYTNATNFVQPEVTLKKGQTLQLTNKASDIHLISLGRWENGTAHPEQEPGAPQVSDLQISGNSSVTIGPWTTPGTYYLYCSIHRNMQLKVIVQ